MSILSIERGSQLLVEFRIYVEQDGEQSDVRLATRAVLYVLDRAVTVRLVDNLPSSTTAYDRVDDRTFPGDV